MHKSTATRTILTARLSRTASSLESIRAAATSGAAATAPDVSPPDRGLLFHRLHRGRISSCPRNDHDHLFGIKENNSGPRWLSHLIQGIRAGN